MRFLYYINHPKSVPDGKKLSELGLDHLSGMIDGVCGCKGPDGSDGIIFKNRQDKDDDTVIRYNKDDQVWKKCNEGNFWIGYYKNKKPKPDDLIRENYYPGHFVTLNDKNKWLIPVARTFDRGVVIPQTINLDESGNIKSESIKEFVSYSRIAEDIYNDFQIWIGEGEGLEPKVTDIKYKFDIAIEALRLNYYLEKWEISALGMINTSNLDDINKAIIDFPFLEEFAKENSKKKDSQEG